MLRRGTLLWGLSLLLVGCPQVDPEPIPDLGAKTTLDPDEIQLKVSERCPGDPKCAESGDGVLYAGYGVREVTPEIETFTDSNKNSLWDEGEPYVDTNGNGKFDAYWMAGYGNGRLALGVHDPVWARALALKQNQTLVVVVSVDTLGLFRDDQQEIEQAARPEARRGSADAARDAPASECGSGRRLGSGYVYERHQSLLPAASAQADCRGGDRVRGEAATGAGDDGLGAGAGRRRRYAALCRRLARSGGDQSSAAYAAVYGSGHDAAAADRDGGQLGASSRRGRARTIT
jgi:hypothetical protein